MMLYEVLEWDDFLIEHPNIPCEIYDSYGHLIVKTTLNNLKSTQLKNGKMGSTLYVSEVHSWSKRFKEPIKCRFYIERNN